MMYQVLLTVCCLYLALADNRIAYDQVTIPWTNYEKHHIRVSTGYRTNFVNSSSVYTPMTWAKVIRSGEIYAGVDGSPRMFGVLRDKNGVPLNQITCTYSAPYTCATNSPLNVDISKSSGLDFTSILPETTDGDWFRVTSHMEDGIGQIDTYRIKLDRSTCRFGKPQDLETVDFSAYGGTWVPCAGSVSPWNTHLGSEEYEPNARYLAPSSSLSKFQSKSGSIEVIKSLRYWGIYPEQISSFDNITQVFNPYYYGYTTEINYVNANKTAVKHFSMGRKAHEMALVMPDLKTVYTADDGGAGVLNMFVATTAGDLTAGELFCAVFTQTGTSDSYAAGLFTIAWTSMGTATNDEIKTFIDSGKTFDDIFEPVLVPDATTFTCTAGYTFVYNGDAKECLKLKSGMEKFASRLETRRYAGMLGCTIEFSKMEGITLDTTNKRLYLAMSSIDKAMKDNDSVEKGGPNHVRLLGNVCGCVYQLEGMGASDWKVSKMSPTLCGRDQWANKANFVYGTDNRCDVTSIASPDNVAFDDVRGHLLISEDTSYHQNDATWVYNPKSGELTRIMTSPYGSEFTSTNTFQNGQCSIIYTVVQHPYGESDIARLGDPENTGDMNWLISMVWDTTYWPTATPTEYPTDSLKPSVSPSFKPSDKPTEIPSDKPIVTPSNKPHQKPTLTPTKKPTYKPSKTPVKSTYAPTKSPFKKPSYTPSKTPVKSTYTPSKSPLKTTVKPTTRPSKKPGSRRV